LGTKQPDHVESTACRVAKMILASLHEAQHFGASS
jgi:hypothetical protein